MNPSTAGARVLLDELVRLGVRELVLCPGSRSAPFAYAARALERAGRLRLHVRVDERSAAFLALGLAKVTRVPAVVVTTSGTAVANLHPAVLEAHHGQVPLIVVSADRPPELRGVGANQATDHVGLFGRHTRLTVDLETPSEPERQAPVWRSTAARAFAAATGALAGGPGECGPVQLNVPLRDPLTPHTEGVELDEAGRLVGTLAGRSGGQPWVTLPETAPRTGPWAGAGTGSPDRRGIPLTERTLVVVGDLPEPGLRRAALAWAAGHGLPVVAEPGGSASGPTVLPHGSLLLATTPWLDAHAPDQVVVVGRPTLGREVARLCRRPGTRVDIVGAGVEWADPTHTAQAVHSADVLQVPVDPARPVAEPSEWARAWLDAGAAVAEAIARSRREVPAGTPLTGLEVARLVDDAAPEGGLLFLGSSSAVRDLHLGVAEPRTDVVASRGLAGIDGCLATASGIALAAPDSVRTTALVGDLTFVHDGNALALGPGEPVPDLTVVVADDHGGGIFAGLEYGGPELADDFDRLFATPVRTDLVALATAHGVAAHRVTTAEELATLVADDRPGLRVVVVPIALQDRRAQVAALRSVAAEALASLA